MQFRSTAYMGNKYRGKDPLTDDMIRQVAPSIFADGKHESRSERYAYIPTSSVLDGLRKEGFQPFMVAQSRTRDAQKREHTKHMLRLRHASQIEGKEWNEIILINSHDGTSSYQMMAGIFRQVCSNGMVCGNTTAEVRIPHKGNVVDRVIESAHDVLDGFDLIIERKESMQGLTLNRGEQEAFAHAALALRYDDPQTPAPISEAAILRPRRREDLHDDMWTTFNTVQENLTKGGIAGRTANGRRMTTRAVTGLDADVRLNRSLWILAEKMRELKA